jgi:DnaJ-class molecular chaperone
MIDPEIGTQTAAEASERTHLARTGSLAGTPTLAYLERLRVELSDWLLQVDVALARAVPPPCEACDGSGFSRCASCGDSCRNCACAEAEAPDCEACDGTGIQKHVGRVVHDDICPRCGELLSEHELRCDD